MPPISRAQAGDLLASWLGKNSVDPAILKQIVAETGYNDAPWFGAEKKKVRLVGEIVMANSALVIFAVNQVFTGQDAKEIIDAFLASARKSVFSLLEAKDKEFGRRYEKRMGDYFGALHDARPGVAVSFIFMKNLDLDPLKNGKGQLLVATRFGQSLSNTLGVLRTFSLAATGADAISQLRAIAPREPASATTARSVEWTPRPFFKNQSKEDFKHWFANVEPWNRLDSRFIDVLIDRFYGNPMFEVFVHASQSCDLVRKFVPLRVLFDQGIGEIAAPPRVAVLLLEAGQSSREAVVRLIASRTPDQKQLEMHYGRAMDAFESALIVEPTILPCYLELALLKLVTGKKDDAKMFCKKGLEMIERINRIPFDKSRITSVRTGHNIEEVRQRLQALWDEQLAG